MDAQPGRPQGTAARRGTAPDAPILPRLQKGVCHYLLAPGNSFFAGRGAAEEEAMTDTADTAGDDDVLAARDYQRAVERAFGVPREMVDALWAALSDEERARLEGVVEAVAGGASTFAGAMAESGGYRT